MTINFSSTLLCEDPAELDSPHHKLIQLSVRYQLLPKYDITVAVSL
jgi:hypothetical protein